MPTDTDTIPPAIEQAVMTGDLAELSVEQRAKYYTTVCRSLGLNPLTKPFEFLTLNGKLRLYALRDCADQLRRIHAISIYITIRERLQDLYIVTARAKDRTGREDESTGAVSIGNLKGDALANALMKAETKAKRRVTFSIAGLGWLDETEVDTILDAQLAQDAMDHGEISDIPPATATNTPQPSAAAKHGRPSEPVVTSPLPEGEPLSPDPADRQPTAEDIDRLFSVAQSCREPKALLGRRLREIMGLAGETRITKKFLRESMTITQYQVALSYYEQMLKRQVEEDVPTHTPPAVADPAAEAKAQLRAEVATWALPVTPEEIDYIFSHYSAEQARALLWGARRPTPALTPLENAAAD